MSTSKAFKVLSPDEINLIKDWAREAGRIGLRHFNKIEKIHNKPDHSFLTQVDLDIEDFLVERIRKAYPDYDLISEEKHAAANSKADLIWVIDPLDGTTAFVQGLPGWGISIGLLHRGQPCFGLFYMPLSDDITYTTGTDEVYCNLRDIRQAVRAEWGQKDFLAVTASAHHRFELDVSRTRALGSIGANLVYTARGSAAAAFLFRAHLWDLVAGAAILRRAGGELRYLSGCKIDYVELLDGRQTPEPIIAGSSSLLAKLHAVIRPRVWKSSE